MKLTLQVCISFVLLSVGLRPSQALLQCNGTAVVFDPFTENESACRENYDRILCDYRCRSATVHAPSSEEDLRQIGMLLDVRHVNHLTIEPRCWSSVKIHGGHRATTISQNVYSHCSYQLVANHSEFEWLDNEVNSLDLINSRLGHANLPHLLHLSVVNSSISSVDSFEFPPSTSLAEIKDSSIRDLMNLNFDGDFLVFSNVDIRSIGPGSITFSGRELRIENSRINDVSNKGIIMTRGKLVIKNTIIDSCTFDSIIGVGSKVTFQGVTIAKAVKSAFKFLKKSDIILENLKIEGNQVDDLSDFAIFEGESEKNINSYLISYRQDEFCSRNYSAAICDFEFMTKSVFFDKNALPLTSDMAVHNAGDFNGQGDFGCAAMSLQNVKGHMLGDRMSSCPTGDDFYVSESSLSLLSIPAAVNFEIRDSIIIRLQDIEIQNIFLEKVDVHSISNIKITRNTQWSNTIIREIASLNQEGSINISNGTISNVVDWSLYLTNESTIEGSTLHNLARTKSFIIETGILTLRNVLIKNASPGSIFLQKGATLKIQNVTFDPPNYGIIFATHENQVEMSPLEDNLRNAPFIYTSPTDSSSVPNDTQETPFPQNIGLEKPFCFEKNFSVQCDFSGDSDIIANVSTLQEDVILANVDKVIIYPKENQRVSLFGAKEVDIIESSDGVPFHFSFTNSKVNCLRESFRSLRVSGSTVSKIRPNPLHLVTSFVMLDSAVEQLSGAVYSSYLRNSTISEMEALTAQFLEISNSKVISIKQSGALLVSGATLWGVQVEVIKARGVQIFGKGELIDVKVSVAEENAIVIEEGASIAITRVSFEDAEASKVFLLKGEVHAVENLRIGDIVIDSLSEFEKYYPNNRVFGPPKKNREGPTNSDDGLTNAERRKFIIGGLVMIFISLAIMLLITGLLLIKRWRKSFAAIVPEGRVYWRDESGVVVTSQGVDPRDEELSRQDLDELPNLDGEETTNYDEKTKLVPAEVC